MIITVVIPIIIVIIILLEIVELMEVFRLEIWRKTVFQHRFAVSLQRQSPPASANVFATGLRNIGFYNK